MTHKMPQPVVIEDYDPEWPALFAKLRAPVGAALGDLVVAIEHVGSTAVPKLAAKPIIDMDVVISSLRDLSQAIQRMATIGYVHEGDFGVADREAFEAPRGSPAHHLYICSAQSPELRRHLAFRDFLRTHPDDVRAYADLKRALAVRFGNDRVGYALAKSDFVNEILLRAARDS
jgi:GrpB-like predicted nucleotidyltransferase (UPF0157 family)